MRLVPVGGRIPSHRWAGRPARVLARVAAVTAGLVLVTGCHVPFLSSNAAAPMASGTTIRVAATPGVADAPLYIAYQQGLFRDAGLNVRIVNYSSVKAELRDLRANKIDVAFGDYADMFYAQAQAQALAVAKKGKSSLSLQIVADGYDAGPNVMEVLALPSSHIVSPRDLQGKSIGTTPADIMPSNVQGRPYNLETVATQSVLSNDNVDLTGIKWQPLPSQALVDDLRSGQVDAILATEPTIFQAESQLGAVPVLDSCTGATANLPLDGYFSLHSFAQQQPAALTAFRSALLKAQATAVQEGPVRAALQGSVGMSVQAASLVTLGQYPTSMSASNLQRVVKLLYFSTQIPTINGGQLAVQPMIWRPAP
jgi:NitT/TauT family transport system substrate-binding protein